MNSTKIKLKKILSNRNTVMILCALAGIIVLFVAYNIRVNQAVQPIRVPVAAVTIQPRMKITDDMIEYKSVARDAIDPETALISADQIINYYSRVNTVIPKGSLFYTAAVVSKEERPDSYVDELEAGETLYSLGVDINDTYGNSLLPGSFIDIYIETSSQQNKALIGRFISNIKLLAVKDSNGDNVFENSDVKRTPATIIFALPDELHTLLLGAQYINNISGAEPLRIRPIPILVDDEDAADLKPSISNMATEEFVKERMELLPDDYASTPLPSAPIEEETDNEE